jgi:hypothetical protein
MADTSGQGKVAIISAHKGCTGTLFRKRGRQAMRDFFKPLLNVFGKPTKNKPRRIQRDRRLALEGLETRLAPAIDVLITSGGDPSSYSLVINNGTATFTAFTSGCKIDVATIQAQLAAGNDVVIDNSNTVLPFPEEGKITWDTTLDLTSIPPSGSGRTITLNQSPGPVALGGTGAAPIVLGSAVNDFLAGDSSNNVKVVVNPAGTAPSTGPKVQFYGSSHAVQTLAINADTVGYVEFVKDFATISDMTIKAQSVVAGGTLTAGSDGSSSGKFTFTSASSSGGGIITFKGASAAITAIGDISVGGSLGTTNAGTPLTLSGAFININGKLGVSTTPFGIVTLSTLDTVTVADTGAVEKIVADSVRSDYDLVLNGGILFTDTNPTVFDNLGTVRLGNTGAIDKFIFAGGLDLTSNANRVTITNSSLTSYAQPILLGNSNLATEVHLITGPAGHTAGANITLDTNPTIASGTKLTFNSGTNGVTNIYSALKNVGAITIDNSQKTVFHNPVTLTSPLNINQTQTDVIFSKASTIGAVNMLPNQNFRLNLAAAVTVNGPIAGTEQIVMTGTGSPQPISTINGTGNNYFGSFVSSAGILAVNGTYINAVARMDGGVLTGTGLVKVLNSGLGVASRTLAPGGFTPTTTTTGGVTTTVNVPTVGTFTATSISMLTNTLVSVDLASATSSDLIVSASTVTPPSLGGASLTGTLLNNYIPAQGTKFTLVDNQSTQPIIGIFAGIPEGGSVSFGGVTFRVSYVGVAGSDGIANDVILTTLNGIIPPGPTPTPGNGDYVFYLYNSILGRNPDTVGFNNFVAQLNAGVSRASIATALYYSAEQRSNQVQGYYQTYLNRTASAAEVNGWVSYFLAGATDFQVQTSFLTSNEFMAMNPPITNYIQGLYKQILGRSAGQAEVDGWTKTFMASVPKQQIVMSMLTSTEATQRLASQDYLKYLGRIGDVGGVAYWGSVIASMGPGAGVIGFTSSAEAFNRAQLLY